MKFSFIAILATGSALAAGTASANHVDFFSDGAFDAMGPGTYTQTTNPGNTLGGMRTLNITGDDLARAVLSGVPDGAADESGVGPSDATADLTSGDSSSAFAFDYAFMADFIDIPDSDETWNAAQIEIVDYMGGDDTDLTVTISDADSMASQTVSFGSAGNLIFDYGAFDGIDFSAVTGFSALFEAGSSTQLSLGGFTRETVQMAPIPLPAGLPLALGAFGLMGWVARKRRG